MIGQNAGSASLNVNSNSVGTSTVYVRQKNTVSPVFSIMELYNNAGNPILTINGAGGLELNSGGAITGLKLAGGANFGWLRATPANNGILEKVLVLHALGNITKSTGDFNLVTIGSLEGAAPTGRFTPTSGTSNFITINSSPYINQTGTASGNIYGFYYNPANISVLGTSYAFYGVSGKSYFPDETNVGSNTDNGDFKLQVTGGVRLDATSKTIALVGLTTDNTATQVAAKDGSGNTVWRDVSSMGSVSAITADNGLTANTSTNVRLGSSSAPGSALVQNSFIDAATFYLQMTGTATQTLRVDNTGSGNAITVNSTTGNGINASASSSGIGVSGSSSSGAGVLGQSTSANGVTGISSSSYGVQGTTSTGISLRGYKFSAITAAVTTQMQLSHGSSGTTAAGFGNAIDFQLQDASAIERVSTRLISKWTDAIAGTRTSQFVITGVNSGATADLFTLSGSGALQLNKYGINTFAGVAAYVLGVDASGNLVEVAAAGAGMTNVLTVTGSMIYSSSGTTPSELLIGTTGQVLQVSAGGIPEWVTPGVGGSVTSVAAASSGIFSYTGSPITTSGTLTLVATGTSGGIPYFSAGTTLSTSALLSANAIMIGGGAGTAPLTTTTGTGVLTALGINVGSAGAFITFNGASGTPSSITLTNGVSLPVATGISGFGTGVATALAVNTGSAGAFVLFNGNMGTPTNGTVSTGVTLGDVTVNVTGIDATGDIYYRDAAGIFTRLPIGTAGQLLAVSSGLPAWVAPSAAGVSSATGVANRITVNGTTGTPQTGALTFSLPQDIHTSAIPTFRGGIWSGGSAGSQVLSLSSTAVSVGILNGINLSPTASGSAHIYQSTSNQITEPGSGTAPLYTTMYLGITTVTAGAGLVDNTASLYVQGSMAGVVNGGNYSIWVDAGPVRIDDIAGAGRYVTTDANGVLVSGFNRTVQTLVDGATIFWLVANGGNSVVTLSGTGRTLTISGAVAGETYIIRIIQGSGGSKTITTWPSGVRWSGGVAPVLSTTAGDMDIITFYYDGSNFYGIFNSDFS